MIFDTSAIISILRREEGWQALFQNILYAEFRLMSAFTLLEAEIVWYGRTRSTDAVKELRKLLLQDLKIVIVPFDERFPPIASRLFQSHGNGIAPRGLNIGDCVVASLAIHASAPVLSTSDEFARAGLKSA